MVNQFDMWGRNRGRTQSVVREKPTTSSATTPSMLQKYIPALAAGGRVGPAGLASQRDAWDTAMAQMQGVNATSPLVAGAQALGMGLAGYGSGKATRDSEAGSAEYRARLSKALSGEKVDNATLMQLAFDPYADQAGSAASLKMWERNNPTPSEQLALETAKLQKQKTEYDIAHQADPAYSVQQDADGRYWYVPNKPGFEPKPIENFEGPKPKVEHNNVTIKDRFGNEIPVDLSTEEGQTLYKEFITKIKSGGPGAVGQGGGIKDAFSITKEFNNDKQYQAAQVATSTLNSMAKSFRDKSAISDLDYIIGLAKILDPTSVVRSSEGEQVQATQSMPAQLAGRLNRLLNGEQALDDKTRADLYRLAERRTAELQAQGEQQRGFYGNIATQNGFDPETYIPKMPSMPNISVGDTPQNYPQRPAPISVPPPSSANTPPAASVQPGATPMPGAQEAAPQRSGGVFQPPGGSNLPAIPPELQRVPMLPQVWGQVIELARNPDGSIDQTALNQFAQRLQQDPTLLRSVFPDAFRAGQGGR